MAALYLSGKKKLWDGSIDLDTDSIYAVFMSTSYTPNIDTEDFYDDIVASVASGSTMQLLANKTLTIDTTNDIVKFDADDISITGQTFTSDMIVLIKYTGVNSTSPLICYIDITTIAPVGGALTVPWNASGIFSY